MQVCTTEIDLLFEEIENKKRQEKLQRENVETSAANDIVSFFVRKDKHLTKQKLSNKKLRRKIPSQYSYRWRDLCYIIDKLETKHLSNRVWFKEIRDDDFPEPYYEINFECYL